ncbi:small acid-soluble spore protein Tlp [Romboutsia sp. 1001216sp1]|uniref:small acid-soluble spore protein Tlp n=1 Tax=Romboutsia TaxID=1501226 RepID=UPI000B89CCFF|nr:MULTISPECIES: small acid-soluble spore protein Tlp [Romboutsia]MDB8791439.1 small acid-soluble spore protein Tlp [Romboutsia sp. 1001216sp1]MDB8792505.1 small acid-soluble spore protein Tlp [Romboutsia sp. 1001216sp1]MDB8795800.1 small acid-soluble spore protein Tlp [Romboutsia sp. 1001216sp1]MDB8798321.1 small acid-soluble spore protein Tlp [Romboutsia sp. 1001216sp1]MDB8800965.1 small acid-soluble spore protein Tlp [Romboutsia sp. 1001216sp1]
MKPNPDDRRDNVEKIQCNINHTLKNIRLANEMIEKVDNPEERRKLEEKNKRREESLNNMRSEIKEEANVNKNEYR